MTTTQYQGFLLLSCLLIWAHSQTCNNYPAGVGQKGLEFISDCSLPAPQGTNCTVACTYPTLNSQAFRPEHINDINLFAPGPNETFSIICQNGTWIWSGVNIDPTIGPYCLIFHNYTSDYTGITVYREEFTGNFTLEPGQTSQSFLRRETLHAPKLYPPADLAIRVSISATTFWGDYVRVTLTDKIGVLGSSETDSLNGVSTEYYCYSTQIFENYQMCCLEFDDKPLLDSNIDNFFYRWWDYKLDITGQITTGGVYNYVNYAIVIEFINGHISVGDSSPSHQLQVNSQDVTIAYFDSPYYDTYMPAPLEITFEAKPPPGIDPALLKPVIVILGDAGGSLCPSSTGSSLFQNILSLGTTTSGINKPSNISYKSVTTFGKFVLTPTSAPPLLPLYSNNKTGKYFIAIYSPNGGSVTTFFNLTITLGEDFETQRTSAFLFILLFPLTISLAYLGNIYFSVGSRFCSKYHCALYPIPYVGLTRYRRFIDYWKSFLFQKTSRPFSFSWLTCIVACVFGVASYQVVISTWTEMHAHGNTDLCFYNERCFRPLETWHIPFNNIISNISYVIVGLGFLINVALVEARERAGQDHSTMYALGFAIIGEGVFSGLYHICPSPNIFQFDTAFMFLMAALMMIGVFQTSEEEVDESIPHRFKAAKIFLFFYAPILIFNYIGTTIDRDQNLNNPIAFWLAVVIWEIAGFMGLAFTVERPRELVKREDEFVQRFKSHYVRDLLTFFIGPFLYWSMVAVVICITIWNAITRSIPIASMFLYLTIAASQVVVFRVGMMRADWGHGRAFLLIFLIIVTFSSIVISLHYFALPVSDKALLPHASRALNSDCTIFNYFDSHDAWHIACSIGLGCAFVLVLNLNPPENETKQIDSVTRRHVIPCTLKQYNTKKHVNPSSKISIDLAVLRAHTAPASSSADTSRTPSMTTHTIPEQSDTEKLTKINEMEPEIESVPLDNSQHSDQKQTV